MSLRRILPATVPGYCASCKRPLTVSRVLQAQLAWCPRCKEVVNMCWFEVPSWTVGVVVALAPLATGSL